MVEKNIAPRYKPQDKKSGKKIPVPAMPRPKRKVKISKNGLERLAEGIRFGNLTIQYETKEMADLKIKKLRDYFFQNGYESNVSYLGEGIYNLTLKSLNAYEEAA